MASGRANGSQWQYSLAAFALSGGCHRSTSLRPEVSERDPPTFWWVNR